MPPDKGRQGMNSIPCLLRLVKNSVETIGAVAVTAADVGADGVLDAGRGPSRGVS
jgi:hypothetical protein